MAQPSLSSSVTRQGERSTDTKCPLPNEWKQGMVRGKGKQEAGNIPQENSRDNCWILSR